MGRDRAKGTVMSLVQLELQGLSVGRGLAAMAGSTAREQINESKLSTYYVPNKNSLTQSSQKTSYHEYNVCLDLLMIKLSQRRNNLPKVIQLEKKRIWP